MKTDAVAILKRAKAHIQRGWIQNKAQSSTGDRVCAAQALALGYWEVTGEELVSGLSIVAPGTFLLTAALELTDLRWANIPMWNDTEGRTQDEVVDTFDHAIKLAERDAA